MTLTTGQPRERRVWAFAGLPLLAIPPGLCVRGQLAESQTAGRVRGYGYGSYSYPRRLVPKPAMHYLRR